MTKQQLIQNLAYQFPHLPSLDLQLIIQTVSLLSLTELKALKYNLKNNETMKSIIETVIQQWEAEAEIFQLEAQHQMWEEYYHCCGKW